LAGPKLPLGVWCLVVMRAPTARGCNVAAAPPRVHNVMIDGLEKVVPVRGARSCDGALGRRVGLFSSRVGHETPRFGCNRPGNTRQVPTPCARPVVASGPHLCESYISLHEDEGRGQARGLKVGGRSSTRVPSPCGAAESVLTALTPSPDPVLAVDEDLPDVVDNWRFTAIMSKAASIMCGGRQARGPKSKMTEYSWWA
jgi:hypothetical protein